MPALALSNRQPMKMIVAAGSGTGKTGALWSLAAAGFKLKIADFDKGTPILASILKDNPEALANVEVCSFTEKLVRDVSSGFMKPLGAPKAWSSFMDSLNKWPDGGSANEWGTDTILVIDSLTMASRRALTYAQHIEGNNKWKPELQHYGVAMAQIEALFGTLYGENVGCHVIWLTHVKSEFRQITDDKGKKIGEEWTGSFPSSIGKALNDVIPRYVNDILSIKVQGEGPTAKRLLSTRPTENRIITKTRELISKDTYLLADGRIPKPGFAEFFADCGWEGPE